MEAASALEAPAMTCPWCGAHVTRQNSLLGALGALLWFRCRYCGGQFSKRKPKQRKTR